MTTENLNTLKELFAQLLDRQGDSSNLDPRYINQLQGVEESLGLLKDVIDELRRTYPRSLTTLKSVTLQMFDDESEAY